MGNAVVIYKSKYGSTKKYAEWISKALNCEILEGSNISINKVLEYDIIIYLGGLYASGINGVSFITKNFEKLKQKELIVCTVGLADPNIKTQFKPIIDKNFTEEMKNSIRIYHLRGGINYKELGIIHKSMMAMLKKTVKNKKEEELTDEDHMMLDTYGDVVDFTDENTIEPIISHVRECTKY